MILVAIVLAAVVAAALMTGLSWVAENGFPTYLLPEIRLVRAGTPAVLPAAPTAYLCPKTNRWRDAVTKKFVARPAA